jgi:[ribosomal protein S18]-alanine N-acetyltransferase
MRTGALPIIPMKRSHIRACNAIITDSEPWKTLRERVDFAKYISFRQAYVCLSDDGLAGFIIFTPDPVFARGGYIRAVAVAPAMRRRGIGKKLITFAESVTAHRSSNMYLCVTSFNRRGLNFYTKCGYIRVGKIPGLIHPHFSEHILWKRLSSRKT